MIHIVNLIRLEVLPTHSTWQAHAKKISEDLQ